MLAGTQRDHYLDVKMTNEPKTGFRFAVIPLAFYVGRVFNKADEQAGFRPVTAFAELGLKHVGLDFISKTRDDFYNQHELPGGYLILTHSSTDKKKRQLEEISEKLGLELKVEVV